MKEFLLQNWKSLTPWIIVIILGVGLAVHVTKSENLSKKVDTEVKLRSALLDSIHTYQNEKGELVSEKLTLQASVKQLEKMNGQLSDNQKELLERVKSIEKKNDVIAAALIKTIVKIDSLRPGKVTVDTTKNIISVKDSIFNNKGEMEIKYDFQLKNVRPYPVGAFPISYIKELTLPNQSFVEFHWGDKKEGYPINFSITNSNKYFKTANLDSYAIPQLDKTIVKPTFWQKVGKVGKESSKYLIGGAVGAAVILLFVK